MDEVDEFMICIMVVFLFFVFLIGTAFTVEAILYKTEKVQVKATVTRTFRKEEWDSDDAEYETCYYVVYRYEKYSEIVEDQVLYNMVKEDDKINATLKKSYSRRTGEFKKARLLKISWCDLKEED